MKNAVFTAGFDRETGYLTALYLNADPDHMNWRADDGYWGRIHTVDLEVVSVSENDAGMTAEYRNAKLAVRVERAFSGADLFHESYTIANRTDTVVTVTPDNFGIELPWNDRYTNADECMIHHCHAHIWCGHHASWVNALKMGPSEHNLGLALTEGAFDIYSQNGCKSNNRGVFIFHPEPFMLKKGGSYTVSWDLFPHRGTEDFLEKLAAYPNAMSVSAEHFTAFSGEPFRLKVKPSNGVCPTLTVRDKVLPGTWENGTFSAEFQLAPGEHRVMIEAGKVRTWTDLVVMPPFGQLLEDRVRFLVRHQQCNDPESPLCGAFLIYDNETENTYFDFSNPDHNACRERLNIAFLLLKYLRMKEDAEIRAALTRFSDFIFREIYDAETGEVFNTIGKCRDQLRLYNAPGVMLLFAEFYNVTGDEAYLHHIVRLAKQYYGVGGKKCYANGIAVAKVLGAFDRAGLTEEREIMRGYFSLHVENIIGNGLSYPKHEVNYEQTIVTPAVNHISEMGLYEDDAERYKTEARRHLACLERFNGMQPSAHLHGIALRYWDGYWFGKRRTFGDTLPHHLSCLTARAYAAYAKLTGENEWREKAEENLRNCMCLERNNARGSAAYLYPYKLNGVRGQFYDPWSNDQDLILYDALYFSEWTDTFRI